MDISVIQDADCVILVVSGRMDATTVSEFDTAAKEAVSANKNMLIDLQNLEYMSSAGLRSLLGVAKVAKAKSALLAFCSLQPMVSEVFHISGFDRMLQVYADREAGLAALRG